MSEKIQIHTFKGKITKSSWNWNYKHFLRVLICLAKNYCYLSNELNLQFYCTHTQEYEKLKYSNNMSPIFFQN